MRWEKVKKREGESGLPGKRWGHSCNAIKGGKLVYVFGGYGGGDASHHSHTNQLHVFDTESQIWSEPVTKGVPPTPRDSHTCTTVEDNLFVFGGTDGVNPLKDLHVLYTSSNTWISSNVKGDIPEAREGHSAASVGKRIFIFGGCGKSMDHPGEVHYNDLYILDTESFVWQRAVTSGILPAARDSHSCSSWKNKIIVIGGEDEHDYYLSDVHVLDTDTLVWKQLNASGQMLPPRAGHSSVAFGKYIFVSGGFTDDQNLYDDLYMLDVDVGMWTKILVCGDGPSPRFSMSGDCLDPLKDGFLFFMGGCDRNLEPLDDIYYLETGLEKNDGRHERGSENVSVRKQLSIQSQDQNIVSSENAKALITFGTAAHGSPTSVTYNSQQSHQYFHLNMYRPPIGKRTFQAKVTKNFANGFTIETLIDGKPLRGVLFPFSSSANRNFNGKRDADNVNPILNSNRDPVPKTSLTNPPHTEAAVASVSKNAEHSSLGQSLKVVIREPDNDMELNSNSGADMIDQAGPGDLVNSEILSAVAEGSALPTCQESLLGEST